MDEHKDQQVSLEIMPLFNPFGLIRSVFKCVCHYNLLNPFRIPPNLRSTVYCNAIAAGGAEEWDFAWSEFENTTVASEAEKLRSALACTTQTWLLNRSAHSLNTVSLYTDK